MSHKAPMSRETHDLPSLMEKMQAYTDQKAVFTPAPKKQTAEILAVAAKQSPYW